MSGLDLEAALASLEADAEGAVKASGMLSSELRKLRQAAAIGDLPGVRRALAAAGAAAGQAEQLTRALAAWEFDENEYLASGAFTKDVLRLAEAEGLAVFELDERLVS